jgi:hypothetical protein
MDEAAECCEKISTIAGLLNAVDDRRSGLVQAVLVSRAGHLIAEQVDRLSQLLKALQTIKEKAESK